MHVLVCEFAETETDSEQEEEKYSGFTDGTQGILHVKSIDQLVGQYFYQTRMPNIKLEDLPLSQYSCISAANDGMFATFSNLAGY